MKKNLFAKTLFLLSALFIVVYSVCCADASPSVKAETSPCSGVKLQMPPGYMLHNRYTVFFLDYTDERIIGKKACDYLKSKIAENLISPEDKVEIYFITANTATSQTVPQESFTLSIPKLGEIRPGANQDSVMKVRKYACRRLKKLDEFYTKVDQLLQSQRSLTGTVKFGNSDIAGFFYVTDGAFKRVHQPNQIKSIYLISDLEHNCPGFFNLTGTNFNSKTQKATGDAEKDYSKIAKLVDVNLLRGAYVQYFSEDIPPEPNPSDVKNRSTMYWNNLFNKFGLIVNR